MEGRQSGIIFVIGCSGDYQVTAGCEGTILVGRNNQACICPMREANPRKPNLSVI